MRHQMRLNLANRIQRNCHDNQQRCTTEIEWQCILTNKNFRQDTNSRQIGSTKHSQTGQYIIQIICSCLPRSDARSTGTVNLALLAERIPELDDPLRWGIGLWFLVVFGTKAAIFPLFSWLPDSYPTAPTTITAVFAGLFTKIGVYVLIRFHVLTGMDDLGPLILTLAAVRMVKRSACDAIVSTCKSLS